MRHIKIFEEYTDIDSYLKKSTFERMPFKYKKAILIRAYEVNEEVEWSIQEEIDWANDVEKIVVLISDYSKTYPNREFMFGRVPLRALVDKLSNTHPDLKEDNIKSVQDFKNWYGGKTEDHGNSVIPILIDDRDPEYIEDGWHRLNSYIKKGIEIIPVVKYL